MAHTQNDPQADHAPAVHTEYDSPPMARLYVWLLAITIVTAATIVGVVAYFNAHVEREQQGKEGARAGAAVRELRQRESDLLSKGGKADDIKPGATREPIARTIARVVADPQLLDPVIAAPPPPAPTPPPTPTPVPAPAPQGVPSPGGNK